MKIIRCDSVCEKVINKMENILNANVELGNLKIHQSVKLGPNIKLGTNPTDKMNISFFNDVLTIEDEKHILDTYYPGENFLKDNLSLTKKGNPIIQCRTQKDTEKDKSKKGGTHTRTILVRYSIIKNKIIIHSINIPKVTNTNNQDIQIGCVGNKLNRKGVA